MTTVWGCGGCMMAVASGPEITYENVSLHHHSHVISRGKVIAHCIYPFPEPIAVTSAAFPCPSRASDVGGVISSHHRGRRIFAIIVRQFCPVFAIGGLRALQTNHGISYIHFSYHYSLFWQLCWCLCRSYWPNSTSAQLQWTPDSRPFIR